MLSLTGVPQQSNGSDQGCGVHSGLELGVPTDVRHAARRHQLGADGGRALRHAVRRQEHIAVSLPVNMEVSHASIILLQLYKHIIVPWHNFCFTGVSGIYH